MIDLHAHTTASDGSLSPAELLALSARRGLTVQAVTDHDTVAGLDAAARAAAEVGVRLVPGIEVSCVLNGREIHVLGHFVDPREKGLASFSDAVRDRRRERMVAMVQRLQGMNVPVTIEQVEAVADGAALARPHLARALVELRVCSSVSDAFHRFLADGREAVVVRHDVTPQQAIDLIHAAGGTASLAHPPSSRVNPLELKELKAWGLDALEVFHPDHPPSQQQKLLEHCAELDLVPTGGSDFHGDAVTPGRRLGAMTLPQKHFARLEARRR